MSQRRRGTRPLFLAGRVLLLALVFGCVVTPILATVLTQFPSRSHQHPAATACVGAQPCPITAVSPLAHPGYHALAPSTPLLTGPNAAAIALTVGMLAAACIALRAIRRRARGLRAHTGHRHL